MKLRRFEGNPILSPSAANDWEALVTTNPGAWYDADRKQVLMLYRAAGTDTQHRIHFGLAVSDDGYHFRRASNKPVFSPIDGTLDGGCVEDARIIKMGDWYYVTYATRVFPPGQYWLNGPHVEPNLPAEFPYLLRENTTSSHLALTKDFKTWIRAGRITDPTVDDRDVILFPEKVGGKFVMLHRPMNWVGPEYGTDEPAMWISTADDLLKWENPKLLTKAVFPWENKKIGGNTPPIKTPHGWLTLYHAVGVDRRYRLGAMLLDLHDPSIVRYRSVYPILEPDEKETYEFDGPYRWGICFPCGNVVIDGKLFVYYGGADKYVGVATCELAELVDYLLTCPVLNETTKSGKPAVSVSVSRSVRAGGRTSEPAVG
jgi:predicted GH43/DUF377 family glycosyl hydrolase